MISQIDPPRHNITPLDMEKYIKKHNFYCKTLNISISKRICRVYQEKSLTVPEYHDLNKCKSCKKFDQTLIKARKKKICKMHTEFKGYCMGVGHFYKRSRATTTEWENKEFCSLNCGSRYNHFKSRDWSSAEDVTGKTKKLRKAG